jgi:gliding motility-associated-like protein
VRLSIRRYLITLVVIILALPVLRAGQINAPPIECINNITSISYTPSSGLTLSAASWTFGDGSSSNSASPKYLYKSIGYFTIKIQATFTNNSTATDSVRIQIVGLPKPAFTMLSKSDSCSANNLICYKDFSNPAISGQNIIKRLMVWGDGDFTTSTNPQQGDEVCHHYNAPDKYLVKIELTDIYGCKNSASRNIVILEQTDALFDVNQSFKDCQTRQVCLSNTSKGPYAATASYRWIVNNGTPDTNPYFSSPKCKDYKATVTESTVLHVMDKNGCRDSIKILYKVLMDSLPTVMTFQDTLSCFNSVKLLKAAFQSVQNDQVIWKIDNLVNLSTGYNIFQFNAKTFSVYPGIHTIYAMIVRGSCTATLSHKFRINGPIAGIMILDNNQCHTKRPVYFVDNSKFVTPNTIYRWTMTDQYSSNCTTSMAQNMNKCKNCIYSLDKNTMHTYSSATSINPVKLWVKDTVTGCSDSTTDNVNLNNCSPLRNLTQIDYCEGELFTRDRNPNDPKYVSFDSGRTWLDFPHKLEKNMKGTFDVGFIFHTRQASWGESIGCDSIKIHNDSISYFDTIIKKDFLNIHAYKKDSISFKVYGNCKPLKLSVHFANGLFLPGESLRIEWDDGGPQYLKTFQDSTRVDSVMHLFNDNYIDVLIKLTMTSKGKCETNNYFVKKSGKKISANLQNAYICNSDKPIKFAPVIYDMENSRYWSNSEASGSVSWIFEDTAGVFNQAFPTRYFPVKGLKNYQIIVNDPSGCSDTAAGSVFLQDLQANVKNTSLEVFCTELKQFFDSSSFLHFENESIISYVWDFGSGTFTNPQKDPFKSLNTSAEFIPVTHAVKTLKGCVDTFRFNLKVRGSHPNFSIKDTIGCDSFTAVFFNRSKDCKGYIWEFGDAAQTSYATDQKENAGFHYPKPGRYNVRLVGYDTVYNPATKATYYCSNVFPDTAFHRDSIRSVLVMPVRKTGISGPDTICYGSELTLRSESDTNYSYYIWRFANDTGKILPLRDSLTLKGVSAGSYRFKLYPRYKVAAYNMCRDSASKTVTVLGIKADFDIDPISESPIFYFHNRSNPVNALLYWDFDQPLSGSSNHSGAPDPSHNYGIDTGNYHVCLRAALPFGCADTVCKDIFNDYAPELLLFNVFTPGNADEKNDLYDVFIEGENYYRLSIYNRWGVLVYEGNEDRDNTVEGNWNGKVMNTGKDCAPGTYYYILEYKMKIDPETMKSVNGTITLIR